MKKFLSVLLAVMMVATVLPVNLMAAPLEFTEHSHSESYAEAEERTAVKPRAGEWYDRIFIRMNSNGFQVQPSEFRGIVHVEHTMDTSTGGTSKMDEYTHNVGQQYQSGKEVIFTAIPDAGYRFDGWYKNDANGELIQTGETWRFISNNENAAYTHYAKFSKDESVTLHRISFIGDPAGLRVRNVNMTKTSGVTFPNSYDYLNFDVEPGWDMSFSIEMGRDYVKTDDFKVVCNGKELVARDGVYTLSNINEGMSIVVSGFAKVMRTTVYINKIAETMQDRDNVVISGMVKDERGKAVTTGTLELLIDDKPSQVQPTLQSDGSFRVELSGIIGGSHKATVKYSGDETHESSQAEAKFFVEGKEHYIHVSSNGYKLEENVFAGLVRMQYTVADENGQAQQMVEHGTDFGKLFPVGQGILLTAIPAAGYKLGGWYKNNENGDLLTAKEEWNINANSIYAAYTHYAKFVRDDSKTTYAVTFADGLARMRITDFNITKTSGTVLPDYHSAPNYTVEPGWSVSFGIEEAEGYIKNADYEVLCNGEKLTEVNGVYTISNINENKEIRVNGIVDKTAPVVTINDIPSVMYGEKVVVSGTVIDVDGKPVTEGTVQVYVDDLAGWPAVALAADGSFTCEISGVAAGEHIATATYFAEKTYVDASANKNFTVLAGHTHCICGGKSESHASHSAVTYTAWDGGEINYENGAAYLYIPADTTVTLENDITIGRNRTLYLCLNDKTSTLASNGSAHFIINGAGARLVICSCGSEQGAFKGRTDGAGNGGCIEIREGNLDIYGGNIGYANCENGGVAYLKSKQSKMNIYGGSLCENTVKNGGAVYINSDNIRQDYIGTVMMYGGVIENNNAEENGGAVYVAGDEYEGTGFNLTDGIIRKNSATGNGGAIFLYIGRGLSVSGGSISENTAENGGGIYSNKKTTAGKPSMVKISGGVISKNHANELGGGIHLNGARINGNNKFSGCEISENTAKYGGGIYIEFGEIGSFENNIVSGNKAEIDGGGIYLRTDTFTLSTGSKVYNNTASGNGGGIYACAYSNTSKLAVSGNADIYGNKANASGGGIYITLGRSLEVGGSSQIRNNSAGGAGGIAVMDGAKVTIKDSASIHSNGIISGSGASQILVSGKDSHDVYSSVTMNGGTIDGSAVRYSYCGIELEDSTAFTINAGTIDVYGIRNGINNQGTFTVNGGVVEALAASGGSSNRAYSARPEVSDTMFAREGDAKAIAKDVDLAKVNWRSKYIYLGTGYRAAIKYFPLGGTLPEGAPEAHVFGTKTVLPVPTKDGYNFDGWYEDTGFTKGPVAEIGADVTGDSSTRFLFYAKWTEVSEWNEPKYFWNKTATGYNCNATRSRKTDATTVELDTATVTYAIITPATCDEEGLGRYTAEFKAAWAETQTKDEPIPKAEHDWNAPTYEWTAENGGYTVTAKRVCKNYENHTETETVTAAYAEITPATCDKEGLGRYTAEFNADWAETQTKDKPIPKIEHDWNAPTYDWKKINGGYECAAKRVCKKDGNHAETETVTATYAIITPATEENEGLGRYTAVFTNAAFTEQKKDETIPKIVHDWGPVNVWWEGEYCIASRTCNAHNEVESERVKGVYSVEKEPGCTTPGRGKYVAYFTNPEFLKVFAIYGSPTKGVNLPAVGHDWDTPSISWRKEADGGYTCDAVHYCKRNEAHFEAASTRATYEVITEPTCEENGLGRYTAVFALADFETQTKDETIPKLNHDWNAPTYDWKEISGGYECTAKRVCKHDASHVETDKATVTYAEIAPATCIVNGEGRYTAKFNANWAETQTKDLTLEALGHDWNAPTYEWKEAQGGYECTAKRVCKHDASHVETDKATVTYAEITPATCLVNGEGRYTAKFNANWAEAQTKDVVLNAFGHDWNAPTYDWTAANGGYECTAKRVCKNDASHVETETVTATYAIITAETCEENGLGRYTAKFNANWAETQTKDVVLNAFGHDWGEPTYRWVKNNDSYKVNAESICNREGCTYIRISVASAEYKVITPATCLENGLGRYTAVFEHEWAETQTKDETIPKLNHDWNAPTYDWKEISGGYECTAKRVCKHDTSHVETETVTATYAIITAETCEENGLGRYTAEFKADWAETQTKDEARAALDHDWSEVTYTWFERNDGYKVRAYRECKRSGCDAAGVSHSDATYAVITPATCLTDGLGRYTANFVYEWAETQTKDVVLNAFGHDWNAPTYDWKEISGGYKCTAKRVCKNDASHVETDKATVTYAEITPATCLVNGEGKYTAKFGAAWAETQTKDVVLNAFGHDWNAPTYDWKEVQDGYECTAKRVCKNDASHVETETVTATYAIVTPETCVKEGLGRYTAEFKADWAKTQTKDEARKAMGHDHSGNWRYNEFEHWRICPVCKDIIDVQAHDLTAWRTILDNRGKDTNREERHCRICAYEQFSTTIHIGGGNKNGVVETNPNTGAEVFIRRVRAALSDNRINEKA